ncbi:MAG: hypothetical protein CMO81_04900 [Waddliaceae bacterium]|nr:hypothetical protein [Waddliaceae bacterium]
MGSNITLSSGAFSNLSDCLGAISDQEIIKNATISIPNKNKSTNYSFYHIKDTHRYQQVVNITITTNLGEYSVRECYDAKAKNSKIAFRSFLGYDKALLNKLTGNLGESAAELKSRVLPFLNTKQVIKGKSDKFGSCKEIKLKNSEGKEKLFSMTEKVFDSDNCPAKDLTYDIIDISKEIQMSKPRIVQAISTASIVDENASTADLSMEENSPKKRSVPKQDNCACVTLAAVITGLAVSVMASCYLSS